MTSSSNYPGFGRRPPPQRHGSSVGVPLDDGRTVQAIGPYTVVVPPEDPAVGGDCLARDEAGRMVRLRFLPQPTADIAEEAVGALMADVRSARVAAHANLSAPPQIGRHEGRVYAVLETAEGAVTAAERLAASGPMTVAEAVRCVRDAAAGLAVLHAAGLTHRDVRPENLLLSVDGSTQLAGAGLSRFAELLQEARLGCRAATPTYAAPELYQNAEPDARCDMYALGATLYCLLAGRPPYQAATSLQVLHLHATAPVPDVRAAVPEAPEAVAAFIRTAMAKKPHERFADAGEALEELDRMSAALPGPARAGKAPVGKVRAGGRSSGMAVWLAAGGAVVTLAAGAAFLLGPAGPAGDQPPAKPSPSSEEHPPPSAAGSVEPVAPVREPDPARPADAPPANAAPSDDPLMSAEIAAGSGDRDAKIRAAERLRPLLAASEKPEVRTAALRLLGRLEADWAVPAMSEGLADPVLRPAAAEGLSWFPERPEALAALLIRLQETKTFSGRERVALRSLWRKRPAAFEEAAAAGRTTSEAAHALHWIIAEARPVIGWHVVGPLPAFTGRDRVGPGRPDLSAPVVEGDARLAWTKMDGRSWDGRVALMNLQGGRTPRSAYAFAEVERPADGDVFLHLHARDHLAVWVNGLSLGTLPADQVRTVAVRRVRLNRGSNTLLLRIDNAGTLSWDFSVAVGAISLPPTLRRPPLLCLFDEEPWLAGNLGSGSGKISWEVGDAVSGSAALKVSDKSRWGTAVAHWGFDIAENPGPGQYRFLTFAWKKIGGSKAALELSDGFALHNPVRKLYAGPGSAGRGGKSLSSTAPTEWRVETVDLFALFGEFHLAGTSVNPVDGGTLMLDRVYLARSREDLERLPPPAGLP